MENKKIICTFDTVKIFKTKMISNIIGATEQIPKRHK